MHKVFFCGVTTWFGEDNFTVLYYGSVGLIDGVKKKVKISFSNFQTSKSLFRFNKY